MAVTPIILSPYSGLDFSTNVPEQILSGTADPTTLAILVNGVDIGSNFNSTTFEWSYPVDLNDGINTYIIQAYDGSSLSSNAVLEITFFPGDTFTAILNAPVGITAEAYTNHIEVVITDLDTPFDGFTGSRSYNLYYTTTSGIGYQKLNRTPIAVPTAKIRRLVNSTRDRLPDAVLNTLFGQPGEFTSEKYLVNDVYEELNKYVYKHDVFSQPLPLDTTRTAFYVMTNVVFDESDRVELESRFSDEISIATLNIDTTIRDKPLRTFDEIASDYINYVYDTDPLLDQTPGSVSRDIYVDPFSNEVEKLVFRNDFISRCQSFLTLKALDDPNGDGVSDPVSSSEYKLRLRLAYGITSDDGTQAIIDDAFDSLASNYGVVRLEEQFAQGYVVLYETNLRTDVIVAKDAIFSTRGDLTAGTQTVFFRAQTAASMTLANKSDFYNPITNRYELIIPVVADTAGTAGNVAATEINTIVSGVSGIISVTNPEDTRFGSDRESNIRLAERAQFAVVGVDSGTLGGYIFDTLAVPGVRNVSVIGGGDPLMVRDILDDGTHVWGTVDIYVQGSITSQATDIFSFVYPVIEEEIFSVESEVFYQISTNNPSVDLSNPIFSVTRVVNATRQAEYDLTGMTIIGGTVIDLDEFNPTNSSIGICETDIIRVDYSYRIKSKFEFSFQPVIDVISVEGDLSGDLNNNYNLIRNSHPLYEGNSDRAGDYLELFTSSGKPSGSFQSITDTVTMLEEFPVGLSKLGILTPSITVTSLDSLTTYVENVDYEIILPADDKTQFKIRRIAEGSIPNADDVLVSYQCGENITVTYSYNALPTTVLRYLKDKHIDADVLVKAVSESGVDIDATVTKPATINEGSVDKTIRRAISKYFSDLKIGTSIYESDIIALIDDSVGVDFVLVPLKRLARSNNNPVIDEQLSNVSWVVHTNDIVTSWITTTSSLKLKTIDKGGRDMAINGGPGYERRITGVRFGDRFYPQVDTEAEVARGNGRSYIRSDGKVILSMHNGEDPNGKIFYVTYFTFGELGHNNIFASGNEILKQGTVNLRIINNTGASSI